MKLIIEAELIKNDQPKCGMEAKTKAEFDQGLITEFDLVLTVNGQRETLHGLWLSIKNSTPSLSECGYEVSEAAHGKRSVDKLIFEQLAAFVQGEIKKLRGEA
jgi:hypothetical protein